MKRKNRVFKHIEASIWNVWRCNLQNFGLQILIPSRAVKTTSEQAKWFYLLHRWKSLHCCSTDECSKWSRLRTASDKEAWCQLSAFSADQVHIHCWTYRCCLSECEMWTVSFLTKQSAIIVWIKWWFCSFTDMNSQYTNFYISQGSTVTMLRWGGQIIYHLMPNFLRLPYTEKLLISVNFWLSYYKNKKGGVFFASQWPCWSV